MIVREGFPSISDTGPAAQPIYYRVSLAPRPLIKRDFELISLRSNGENRVEHYGKDFDEKCNLGLVKGHYFINDYTELTSYCLDNYEEIKDR